MDYEDEMPCGGYQQEDKNIEKDMQALSLENQGAANTKQQSASKKQCCSDCQCHCQKEEDKQAKEEKVLEAPEKQIMNEPKKKVTCKKCKEHQAVLVHKNQPICKECLLKSIEYKTRLALENKIGIRQNSRILICFSGALNSICLLNILLNIKGRYQKCPLFADLQCVHIQQQSDLPENYLKDFEEKSGLKLNVIPIQKIYEEENKTFEEILQLFKSLKKNSNSIDLLSMFRERLIRKFATQSGFDFVLMGKNGESLAAEIFKYFTKGIGGSASQLSGSEPGFFNYPLKQHLQKELQYYFHCEKLSKYSLLAGPDDLSNVASTQLDGFLNNFITTLQDKYSHTAPAIVRTGDRIKSNMKDVKHCSWCFIPHNRDEKICQKCIRLSATLSIAEMPKWMIEEFSPTNNKE